MDRVASEAASSLDVFKVRQLIGPVHYQRGIQLLEGVVGMLTKMVKPSTATATVASRSTSPTPSTSTSTPNRR